jgi:hypothetical protein
MHTQRGRASLIGIVEKYKCVWKRLCWPCPVSFPFCSHLHPDSRHIIITDPLIAMECVWSHSFSFIVYHCPTTILHPITNLQTKWLSMLHNINQQPVSQILRWGDLADKLASSTLLLLCRSRSAQKSCIYMLYEVIPYFYYWYFIRSWNQLGILQWIWILVFYWFQLIINIKTAVIAEISSPDLKPTHQSYNGQQDPPDTWNWCWEVASDSYKTDRYSDCWGYQQTAAYLIVSKESCGTRELSRLTWSWCPSIQPICGRLS